MDLQKNQDLYKRIKRAVAESSTQKSGELDGILTDYHGDPRLLKHFLDLFGSYNPWQAASNAHLRQAILRTTKEVKAEGLIHGISASGHELSDQIFVYTHANDPTRVWKSGSQAITKILEVFGTQEQKDAYTRDGQERIQVRKAEQAKKVTDNIVETLEEVLQDPSRISDVQSLVDRHKIHAILGLDEELKRRMVVLLF